MFGMRLGRFLPLFSPTFDWIQIEITSYCNAACIYCPRTAYKNSWSNRHLPFNVFMELLPTLSRAKHLHLQGWGEPLLNPDFFKMASLAKKEGLRVGTTTNGMLLDQGKSARLIETGVDIIAFSLAGSHEKSNDTIRRGTQFSDVMRAIETLTKEKIKRQRNKPVIHIAYMVFKSGMNDLEKIPRLLAEVGVSQVVLSTLDFVASEELQSEVIRPSSQKEYTETASYFHSLVKEGEKRGLHIHYYLPPFNSEGLFCTENVQKAFCIASDGAITPCVFTNLQVGNEFHFLQGEKQTYRGMSFGNVQDQSPLVIWNNEAYKNFRNSFSTKSLAPACTGCPKIGQEA